jgi:hypothetical protein
MTRCSWVRTLFACRMRCRGPEASRKSQDRHGLTLEVPEQRLAPTVTLPLSSAPSFFQPLQKKISRTVNVRPTFPCKSVGTLQTGSQQREDAFPGMPEGNEGIGIFRSALPRDLIPG